METGLPTVKVFKLDHENLEKGICTSARHNLYEGDFTHSTL